MHGYDEGRRQLLNIDLLFSSERISVEDAERLIAETAEKHGLSINDMQSILSPSTITSLVEAKRETGETKTETLVRLGFIR